MKRAGILIVLGLIVCGISGCGNEDEDTLGGSQQMAVDGTSEEENVSGDRAGEMNSSVRADYTDFVKGLIENQSFEVELDGWGRVFFAAAAPSDDSEPPYFVLLREEEVVYTFPKAPKSVEDKFVEVSAVAFRDYNRDGKKDVIVLITYENGEGRWNEPVVFLQENSDNMFYLDHPELESYRIEGPTETGTAFYRDVFLEEYLSNQGLADSVADLADSWTGYVDYADSLTGVFSEERQIELFAENMETWAVSMDYANDINCFTLASLGYDGKITLIVANQGGTGAYTYSNFYQIDGDGELKKLETSFREGDSQPDLIEESMTVYSSFSTAGMRKHFIVYDMLKEAPDRYLYRVSSLSLQDDFVIETPLASQTIVYEGEDSSAYIISQDCNGKELTEEEYDRFADYYYEKMGLTKGTAVFKWMDMNSLEGIGDEDVKILLKQSYDGFSIN